MKFARRYPSSWSPVRFVSGRNHATPGRTAGPVERDSRRLWTLMVLLTGCAGIGNASPAAQPVSTPDELITSIGKAHDLSPKVAARARVHLTGTVTFYDPSDEELFIQDETGGIYVTTDRPYPIHIGDLLQVDGRASASYRTEVASGAVLRILGHGETLPAPEYSYPDMAIGRGDCRLIRIRGWVRAANLEQHVNAPSVHMDVVMPGGRVEVYLASPAGFHPESMLDREVEITGVSGGIFDAKNQLTGSVLYAGGSDAVRILNQPKVRADLLPLTDIDNVFQSRFVSDLSQRVRVHGTVTYYKAGESAVLESNAKSLFVQTRQTDELAVGDVVDALGFGSTSEYAPSLRDAYIIKTGGFEQIAPRPITYTQALSGLYSDNLISITGTIVSQLHRDGSDVLVVESDGHLVTAYVQRTSQSLLLPIGSRISIAGICRIRAGGPWRTPFAFHLDVRNEADIHFLAAPSWWTVTHLMRLLGGLAAVALLIAIWALALRRRIVRQSKSIRRSMIVAQERSHILEQISSNASPEDVLATICGSIRQLMPGFQCAYHIELEDSPSLSECPAIIKSTHAEEIRVTLTNPDGDKVGLISVAPPKDHKLTVDESELIRSLTELSTIAVRQNFLYRGLLHHSTHDALTDLPNRRLCESELSLELAHAANEQSRVAVIYVDVDRFKQVNDKYGHKTGDVYLLQIAKRLSNHIRATDTLARIGGDEFLIVMPLSGTADDSEVLAGRLKSCFDQPFAIEGNQIKGSASFGVALYPDDGLTADELKRHADYAMYLAKRAGAEGARAEGDIAVITQAELSCALQRDQFSLAYQPQFSSDGRLTGIEALLRLNDPILGMITPDAFISVAERCGIICEIGDWVLRTALRDAVRWGLHQGKHVLVAVNISMRQIEQHGFAQRVLHCLQEAAFPADRLELELVERSLISNSEELSRELAELRAAGVRLSLDDFGTGESCLSMLHSLPVDTIKIDRSFIFAMDHEPKVLPIIQAISFIARSLGKRIVAEGIEHVGPVPTLMRMGPVEFQGYLLGRPMPAREIDHLMPEWRADIAMPSAFDGKQLHPLRLPDFNDECDR